MTEGTDPRDGLIRRRLEDTGSVVIFSSGKGGVGKSTIAACSAYLMAGSRSVGILDMDIHGPSIPALFGARGTGFRESRDGLIPARVENIPLMSIDMFAGGRGLPVRGAGKVEALKDMLAITNFGPIDMLVVDMPPGTGDEFLTALEMFGDRCSVLFVTQPSALSWNVTRRAVEIALEMKSDIAGVIQNMGKRSGRISSDCSRMHVPSLGAVGYHSSVGDRTVRELRGSAFMRELKKVLENASLL